MNPVIASAGMGRNGEDAFNVNATRRRAIARALKADRFVVAAQRR